MGLHNARATLTAVVTFALFFSAAALAEPSPKSSIPDKTAIDLIGPNGKPVKGAQLPSPSGEDLSSLSRKQAILDHYYIKKICGKKLDSKESPLIVAIRNQDMAALMKLSKQKKFNANGRDVCGMTALQNAILQGQAPMVQFLLDHHASLKKTNLAHDNACATLKDIDDQNLTRFLDRCPKTKTTAKNSATKTSSSREPAAKSPDKIPPTEPKKNPLDAPKNGRALWHSVKFDV